MRPRTFCFLLAFFGPLNRLTRLPIYASLDRLARLMNGCQKAPVSSLFARPGRLQCTGRLEIYSPCTGRPTCTSRPMEDFRFATHTSSWHRLDDWNFGTLDLHSAQCADRMDRRRHHHRPPPAASFQHSCCLGQVESRAGFLMEWHFEVYSF